jgi:hypothetical protein
MDRPRTSGTRVNAAQNREPGQLQAVYALALRISDSRPEFRTFATPTLPTRPRLCGPSVLPRAEEDDEEPILRSFDRFGDGRTCRRVRSAGGDRYSPR